MTAVPETAEVLLALDNLARSDGPRFLVLRDAEGRFALAKETSPAAAAGAPPLVEIIVAPVAFGTIAEAAARLLAGDAKALTHPRIAQVMALAIVGAAAVAARREGEG